VIDHWLNRTLELYRRVEEPDGMGGAVSTWVKVGDLRCKVDQPSASERMVAAQSQSNHSHNVYTYPDADVQRGDEFRDGDGLALRVIAVVQPSTPIYNKCLCERAQYEQPLQGG